MNSAAVETLPNIGPRLGARLRAVGVSTAADFLAEGDAKVFARLSSAFPDEACSHTRLALAGAAHGVRWHDLPDTLKARVKQELR